MTACGPCGTDQATQILCSVALNGPVSEVVAGAIPSASDARTHGPHPVWSTQPHRTCNQNPRIPATSGDGDIELLLTYPAAVDPIESGFGDMAVGQWPVVMFAHANSYAECRRLDAYQTLHEHWASWGFIVVSVDAVHLCEENSRSNLEDRRDDLLHAWNHVKNMAEDPDSPLFNRVDTGSVVLAGHSRGATAALLASLSMPEANGLIWMQGVDTAGYHLGHEPTSIPALGIVAGRDRDIRFPRAEPTREQFSGPHTWATILGGIHAYTSDDIIAKRRDQPTMERVEQLAITTELTTLLLAATLGLSDGTQIQPIEDAKNIMFGEPIRHLNERVLATWQPHSNRTILLDDFEQETNVHSLGGTRRVGPNDIGTPIFTWSAQVEESERILGDSHSLHLHTPTSSMVGYELHTDGRGIPISQGSQLSFLVKNLNEGVLTIRVNSNTDERSWSIQVDRVEVVERFQQIVLDLAPDNSVEITGVTIELNGEQAIIDDVQIFLAD